MKLRKAVIPAAGLGTRLLPATKAVPKEMLPIVDRPAIQLIVEECVAAGIELVVLISGRYKGALSDHFDVSYEVQDVLRNQGKDELLARVEPLSSMVDVVSIRQNRPLGLGHAVHCAHTVVGHDEPFAVLLPDDLIDAPVSGIDQLRQVHEEESQGVIGLVKVPAGDERKYGMVAGEEKSPGRYLLNHLVEKPPVGQAPSDLGICGRYVLPGETFRYIEETKPGIGGEIQLTDALVKVMEEHGLYGHLMNGKRYDTGDVGGLIEANVAWAMKRPELAARLKKSLAKYL